MNSFKKCYTKKKLRKNKKNSKKYSKKYLKKSKRKHKSHLKSTLKKNVKREIYKGGRILTHTAAYSDKANPPGSFNPDLFDIPTIKINTCKSGLFNKQISMIDGRSNSVDPIYTSLNRSSPP